MTEQPQPKLDLGTPPGNLRTRTAGSPRRIMTLMLLQLVTLGLVALILIRGGFLDEAMPANADSADTLRVEALELEDRSLSSEAAAVWERYLDRTTDPTERIDILYRIGRLYLDAEQFERAAAAFVRCELAAGDDKQWQDRIAPKIVECLRRTGRFGEVDRELSRRVEVGGEDTGRGRVLATMAGDEITEADLDRMIEQQVDANLAMMGQAGNEPMRKMLLERQHSPQEREQMLQQLLQIKLFTRRARELKLDQDDDFKIARQAAEDMLLAQRFTDRELGKIVPTPVDLEAYYQTHPADYQQPESLTAVTIELAADEDAKAVLDAIDSPETFRKLAAERAGAEAGDPPPQTIERGRPDPRLGDTESLFALSVDQWTAEPIEYEGHQTLVLIAGKTPARVRPLEEVAGQVELAYQRQKQQELAEKLFRDLMTRYDVELKSPPPAAQPEPEVQQP